MVIAEKDLTQQSSPSSSCQNVIKHCSEILGREINPYGEEDFFYNLEQAIVQQYDCSSWQFNSETGYVTIQLRHEYDESLLLQEIDEEEDFLFSGLDCYDLD